MTDKVIAVSHVKHNGVVFAPGEVVQGLNGESLDHLVAAGAVEVQKSKPAPVAKKVPGKKEK